METTAGAVAPVTATAAAVADDEDAELVSDDEDDEDADDPEADEIVEAALEFESGIPNDDGEDIVFVAKDGVVGYIFQGETFSSYEEAEASLQVYLKQIREV
jgi:hypothetical protein